MELVKKNVFAGQQRLKNDFVVGLSIARLLVLIIYQFNQGRSEGGKRKEKCPNFPLGIFTLYVTDFLSNKCLRKWNMNTLILVYRLLHFWATAKTFKVAPCHHHAFIPWIQVSTEMIMKCFHYSSCPLFFSTKCS